LIYNTIAAVKNFYRIRFAIFALCAAANKYAMLKTKIQVLVHHPQCSIQSAHGVMRALALDYTVTFITNQQLTDLSACDLLIIPGGIGDSDHWHSICEHSLTSVQQHVLNGGYYLGICMGAYWAGPLYFNLLQNSRIVQHIRRKRAFTTRSYGTVIPVVWQGQHQDMYFYDGCSILGDWQQHEVIARYSNRDPAAVISGRVAVIGPHPESDVYWYNYKKIQGYWHNYSHHQLLLNLVQDLLKND